MTADFRTAPRNSLVFFVAALLVAHFGSTMAGLLPTLSPASALPRYFGLVLFVLSALTVFVAAGCELTGRQVGGRLVEGALVLVVVNLAIAAGDGGLRGIVRRLGSLSALLDGATAGASVVALVVWNASTGFAANLVGLLEGDVEGIRLEYAGLARDRLTGCRGDLTVYLYHFRSVLSRTMLLGVAVSVAFAFARKYASLMPGLAVVLIQVKAACLSLVELAVSGARVLWYPVFRGRSYVASRLGGGAGAAET